MKIASQTKTREKAKLRPKKSKGNSKRAAQLHNQTLDPVVALKNNSKSSKKLWKSSRETGNEHSKLGTSSL